MPYGRFVHKSGRLTSGGGMPEKGKRTGEYDTEFFGGMPGKDEVIYE